MEEIIVGYCPYCKHAGAIIPVYEDSAESGKIFFVCSECDNIFATISDVQNGISSPTRFKKCEKMTLQQAIEAGLGEYVMHFDGQKWVNAINTESKETPSLSQEEREVIHNYLTNTGLDEIKANKLAEPFYKHADIGQEFISALKNNGKVPSNGIVVNAGGINFSAKSLIEDHKLKNVYESYSYLIFLREDKAYAIDILKRGFPIKD